MKKYKWLIVSILLLIEIGILMYLGYLRVTNVDMSEMRLLITYWKEYVIGVLSAIFCYVGICRTLKD